MGNRSIEDIEGNTPPITVCSEENNNVDSSTVITATESAIVQKAPLPYSEIRIDDSLWNTRLQDEGCAKEQLEKLTYRQNKISPFGPKDNPKYYEEAQVMMKTVVDLFYEKEEANSVSTMSDSFGKEETLNDLMKLHDMYMNNLKFHKENGTLTPKRQAKAIAKIDNIFAIIEEKQNNRKRPRESSDNDSSSVS